MYHFDWKVIFNYPVNGEYCRYRQNGYTLYEIPSREGWDNRSHLATGKERQESPLLYKLTTSIPQLQIDPVGRFISIKRASKHSV